MGFTVPKEFQQKLDTTEQSQAQPQTQFLAPSQIPGYTPPNNVSVPITQDPGSGKGATVVAGSRFSLYGLT